MASYVEEELKLVQDELLSSEEVLSKVKLEMQKAMSSGDPFRTEAIIVNTIKGNCFGISNNTINLLHSHFESNLEHAILHQKIM